MKRLYIAAALLVGLYLIGLGALFLVQRNLIYPAPNRPWPEAPGFETVGYKTADGLHLRALYQPAQPGKPTIMFLHGNGDSLSGSLVSTEAYAQAGYGLLLVEYRGYAGNPGSPDEAGLYADARGARDFLESHGVTSDRMILMAYSLGSGVATQLAMERQPAALVLIAPYTSIPDVVAFRFRGLLPAQTMVLDRFASIDKIGKVHAPILIMHDVDDVSIPVSQGQRLAAASHATLRLFSGHGHELGFSPDAQAAGLPWLDSLSYPTQRQIPAGI